MIFSVFAGFGTYPKFLFPAFFNAEQCPVLMLHSQYSSLSSPGGEERRGEERRGEERKQREIYIFFF
jgi:hypothetical protein